MELRTHRENTILIAAPDGRIDSSNAMQFEEALFSAMQETDTALVLNLAKTPYLSSAGLRTIARLVTENRTTGRKLALCELTSSVTEVVTTSGFSQLVPVLPTEEAATAAVAAPAA